MTLEEILQLQRKRMGAHAGYNTEDELNMSMFDDFESNPAYQVVTHENEKKDVHFIKKQTKFGEIEVFMIARPGVRFAVGDYVIDKHNTTWLCYNLENFPLRKHYLSVCNDNMRWQDNGTIYDMPCVLVDKTSVYSDGLHNTRKIILADDQIMITMPFNEITRTIKHGKRIIFRYDRDEVYRVVRIDKLPTWGIVDIRLRHDEFDQFTDNIELGLADYYEKDDENEGGENNTEGYKIEISGYQEVILETDERYEAKVLLDGDIVDSEVDFTVIGDPKVATIKKVEGNTCVLAIGATRGSFQLKATLKENNQISSTIDIKSVAW